MRYALINNTSNTWASGPYDTPPTVPTGQHRVFVPFNFPTGCYWNAPANGFLDLMTEQQCLDYVDDQAGARREKLLTVAPGQSDLYRRKQAEVDKAATLGGTATLVLSALNLLTPTQRAATYPLLTLEMTVMGYSTLGQSYTLISTAIATTNVKLNAIEVVRRVAKMGVRAASTITAKNAVANGVVWPA